MTAESNYKKFTEKPLIPLIASLSVPTIISMLVTNIYNLADTAFVGTLGNSASGAVGVVFGFMSILQAVGFLFGQGAGSSMSRKLGEKKKDEAEIYASTGFFLSFFFALVISILCMIFINPLIKILGSTDTIAPYAKSYIFFILISAPFCSSSFTLNNLLRYEGKAKLGMIGMMTGAVLNIAGDALFIFVFHMGIKGAGLSTAISQVVGFTVLLSMYLFKRTECIISIKKLTLDFKISGSIFAIGFPSLLRQALGSVTAMLLNQKSGVYGDAAVAAMSIVSRISFFIFSIALGIGQGFQPVSAFNYGAKKIERVKKGFVATLIMADAASIILAIVTLFFTEDIIKIFRDDIDVIEIASRALRLQCYTVFFLPVSMITEMLYQSTGKKLGASVLSSFRGGFIFIPLLFILSVKRGLEGVQESQPLSFVLTGFISIFFIKRYFAKHLENGKSF